MDKIKELMALRDKLVKVETRRDNLLGYYKTGNRFVGIRGNRIIDFFVAFLTDDLVSMDIPKELSTVTYLDKNELRIFDKAMAQLKEADDNKDGFILSKSFMHILNRDGQSARMLKRRPSDEDDEDDEC
jgi:hypothetical protein